jgi:hypothetical protein
MKREIIAEELNDQFRRAWDMIRDTISGFSESDWITAGVDYLVPARIAYHLIETVEYYIGDKTKNEFSWGSRFGGGWIDIEKDRLPKQEDMLVYLEEVEGKLADWIGRCEFADENKLFNRTGKTLLAHALYVLRHTLDHHGQLNSLLYQTGIKKINWH